MQIDNRQTRKQQPLQQQRAEQIELGKANTAKQLPLLVEGLGFNSESKRGEGKDSSSNDAKGGGGSNEELMELVQEFCMSQKLEQTFEKFAIDHSDVFMKALDFIGKFPCGESRNC